MTGITEGRRWESPEPPWSGTVVAEWKDKGRSAAEAGRLRLYALIEVYLIVSGCGWLLVGAQLTGVADALIAVFVAGDAARILFKGSRFAYRMELTQDRMHLEERTGSDERVFEVRRSEPWELVRFGPKAESAYGSDMLISQPGREEAETLRDVPVRIVGTPPDLKLDSIGLKDRPVPLSILLGTWWPDDRRKSMHGSDPSATTGEGDWPLPTIYGYVPWEAALGLRRAAAVALAALAFTLLLTFGSTGFPPLAQLANFGAGLGLMLWGFQRLLRYGFVVPRLGDGQQPRR